MSLCNTFRFFAVFTTFVLPIVGSPVPELDSRQENIVTKRINEDLEQQGSITVELKSDNKGPNYINSLKLNTAKVDTNSIPLDSESTKKNVNKNPYKTTLATDKVAREIGTKDIEKTTQIPLNLITGPINSTNALNMSLITQQVEAIVNLTSRNESTKFINNSQRMEKQSNAIKEDLGSRNNGTIIENQTEVITKTSMQLEYSTPVTLLEITEKAPVNTEIDTATYSPITKQITTTIMSPKSPKPVESVSVTSTTAPTWKKYTVIERKRVTATDELNTLPSNPIDSTENVIATVSEEPTTVTEKSEVMVKLESAQHRILLQDAITSDIPSLEKLKSDLLSFPKVSTRSDIDPTDGLLSTEPSSTITDMTTFPSTFNEPLNTVSSKRAGYLDLSAKNTTAQDGMTLISNITKPLHGPLYAEAEAQDTHGELLDDKLEWVEPQSQLTENAVREELAKKEMLKDNEEISERQRDEEKQIEINTTIAAYADKANATQFDEKLVQPTYTAFNENLSVRPINSDKGKNTNLYPVNPNYKPLKKIEVQPAKPFVRDPDDNSWRNESLSSLGIVFKPKNSSKPFTQVLKNKTETEWNNLSDKDIKDEVPDLRVRLEQIAQKRKSKKKKIDSFGNIVYTDYEENSSSEENTSTPQVEEPSHGTVSTTDISAPDITFVTPIKATSLSSLTSSVSGASEAPALTTTVAPIEKIKMIPKKQPITVTTPKRPKIFNLFDYYEMNDDEDITEYLNMAKIDLKKHTVPIHTTYSPYTSPPLPVLYTNPITQYTPERKGTIQYFPPRTTKRPKKNKNHTRDKINPHTFTDSPKHVLPISYHKLTTPYDSNTYYTSNADMTSFKENFPKNFHRNLYLTTPPLTTTPDEDFSVIANDGGYNRPNYVIKQYKGYINEATHDEHSKSREFTEPPADRIMITDFVKPTTIKDKTTVTEDYDYESEFRKDLLDRFVANFNEKPDRFKSDFPVLYNNSIVHGVSYDEKEVATSRAYFRRPYSNHEYKPIVREPYDPNCENVTVELSPAYELHYYVPEQEEKQEVEPKPVNMPVSYRL